MFAYLRRDEPVLIWTGKAMLDGVLSVPQNAAGLVILLGLGGTFRYDRIRSVARQFQEQGFATLIADLLTADEQQFDERTGHFRTDTPFLASRVREIVEWATTEDATEGMPIALFAIPAVAGVLPYLKRLRRLRRG
jgi:dienelactone hydrolase